MVIEDIVLVLEQSIENASISCNPWEQAFIRSVAQWVRADRPLSIKQANKLQHLITQHNTVLADRLSQPVVAAAQTTPCYRHPLFEAQRVPREVRHLGDNLLGFRFKIDLDLKTQLRRLYDPTNGRALHPFDWTLKIWVVPVTSHNLGEIQAFIATHGFATDEATRAYLHSASEMIGQPASGSLIDEIILLVVPDNTLLATGATEIGGGVTL